MGQKIESMRLDMGKIFYLAEIRKKDRVPMSSMQANILYKKGHRVIRADMDETKGLIAN